MNTIQKRARRDGGNSDRNVKKNEDQENPADGAENAGKHGMKQDNSAHGRDETPKIVSRNEDRLVKNTAAQDQRTTHKDMSGCGAITTWWSCGVASLARACR
jgi:hypothetical protein